MKIKNLLLIAAAASLSLSAFADDLATGDYAWLSNGDPAKVGQALRGAVPRLLAKTIMGFSISNTKQKPTTMITTYFC